MSLEKDNQELKSLFDERRMNVVERRVQQKEHEGPDRREGEERRDLERRRGPGIRRSVERKAAEEGHMTDEQFEFLMAIDHYKRQNNKPFPSWTEVLEVVKALGYRRVAEPCSIESFKEEPVGVE